MHGVQNRTISQVEACNGIGGVDAALGVKQVLRTLAHQLLFMLLQRLTAIGHRNGLHRISQRRVFFGQPAHETGHRRQGCELLQTGNFILQQTNNLFEQTIAKGHGPQSGVTVGDRVENRRVDTITRSSQRLVQHGLDRRGQTVGQGDFNKDQRFTGQSGVKKGKAAAVTFQPTAQVVPVPDFMHGFVLDQLFEDVGRGFPIELAEFQKAFVEPETEEMLKVPINGLEGWVLAHRDEQVFTHFDQKPRAARYGVDQPEQV